MKIIEIKKTAIIEFEQDEICEISNLIGKVLRWFDSRSIAAKGTASTELETGLNKLEVMFDSIRSDITHR